MKRYQEGFAHIILLILVIVFFVVVVALVLNSKNKSSRNSTSGSQLTLSASPSAEPKFTPQPITRYDTLFTYNGRGFQSLYISQPHGLNGGIRSIVLDESTGSIYFTDSQKIMKYSLETKITSVVFTVTESNKAIGKITFIKPNDIIFNLEANDNTVFTENIQSLEDLDLNSGNTKLIVNMNAGIYSGLGYVGMSGNNYIISSEGGDGCGGGGTIYKVNNGNPIKITVNGEGCSQGPRYLGYIESRSSLLMAAVTSPPASPIPGEFFDWDVLYLQDINSGTKNPIFDLKNVHVNDYDPLPVFYNTNTAYLVTKDGIIDVIKLDTKEEGQIKLKSPILGIYEINSDSMYLSTGTPNSNMFTTLNLSTNDAVNLKTEDPYSNVDPQTKANSGASMFLGVWQNSPIFYREVSKLL